ncbi:MAG: N-acetyltransferase [Chloroflexi bacterium]|nr:N-acetyltransferase [Chloroflexota bacterium]
MVLLDVHLRPVADGDLVAISSIYAHYVMTTVITFDEMPPTLDQWREKLEDLRARQLPFLAADVDGRVVGYAYAGPWRPKPAYRYSVEDSIYLEPAYTGKGLGRRLLDALLIECAQGDARQMIAVIADTGDPTSTSALLHRRCGFADVGRLQRVGYKHGRWVDTLLLQRPLGPPDHDAQSDSRR